MANKTDLVRNRQVSQFWLQLLTMLIIDQWSMLAMLAMLAMLSSGEGRYWEGGGNKLWDKIHWNLSRWESEQIPHFFTFYHSTAGTNFSLRDKSQCGRATGRSGDSDPLEKGGWRLKSSLQGNLLPLFSKISSLWLFKWSLFQNISFTQYCHPCPGQCLGWSVKLHIVVNLILAFSECFFCVLC